MKIYDKLGVIYGLTQLRRQYDGSVAKDAATEAALVDLCCCLCIERREYVIQK